jgi:hypothetical protein
MAITRAGEGEAHSYTIAGAGNTPIEKGTHYLQIIARTWYVNKESGWFYKRSAVGTVAITLGAGSYEQRFEIVLGTYDLSGGSRYAPVFQTPLLSATPYPGGFVTVQAHLSGVKKETELLTMFRGAASASLGIVSGMVQAGGTTGVSATLVPAAGALFGGVTQVLRQADPADRIFDPHSGIQMSLSARDISSDSFHLLLHRGADLDASRLVVDEKSGIVLHDGQPLEDGAWVLFQLNRLTETPDPRPWHQPAQDLRLELDNLFYDLKADIYDQQRALTELLPSTHKNTLWNRLHLLRANIESDTAITEVTARAAKALLANRFLLAKRAIATNDPDAYFRGVAELRASLLPSLSLRAERGHLRAPREAVSIDEDTVWLARNAASIKLLPRLNRILI